MTTTTTAKVPEAAAAAAAAAPFCQTPTTPPCFAARPFLPGKLANTTLLFLLPHAPCTQHVLYRAPHRIACPGADTGQGRLCVMACADDGGGRGTGRQTRDMGMRLA